MAEGRGQRAVEGLEASSQLSYKNEVIDYRKLHVWRCAHSACLRIYRVTSGFPATERYGLSAQLRRGAVSTVSNIAEGAGRRTAAEFVQFLSISAGSASEIQAQLELSRDLGLAGETELTETLDSYHEVKRMLYALIDRIQRAPRP